MKGQWGTFEASLPDAYVTAFILRELLELATVEELIAWTNEPVLLPRVTFGRYRGSSWDNVPLDYLDWVVERSDLGEDIKFMANHHRNQRRAPALQVGTGYEISASPSW